MTRTALILGISGQDGAYLSRLLVDKRYDVHGTTRSEARPLPRLAAVGVSDRVTVHTLASNDGAELRHLLARIAPDEIYNLAGLSSVAESFERPHAAFDSIATAHLSLLEAVRAAGSRARIYHSASSECFGDAPDGVACDEATPFAPRSPYANAKAAAHEATIEHRRRFGMYATSGIIFNHESPLRGDAFVTRKIIQAAAPAAAGSRVKLHLGDFAASRDWGYAGEYVEAMWLMLQQREPRDYVIATGESHTIEEFAAAAFAEFGLDAREHIAIDRTLLRPADIRYSRGNPARAARELGWSARTRFRDLVRLLANAARADRALVAS